MLDELIELRLVSSEAEWSLCEADIFLCFRDRLDATAGWVLQAPQLLQALLKKFLPRHRRCRQMTSPFIAEGDPSFPQLRSSKFTRSDSAVCDSLSLSKLLPPCHRMRDFFTVSPSCRAMHEQFDPLVFLVCLLADDFRSPTDSGVRTLLRTDPRAPHAERASNP